MNDFAKQIKPSVKGTSDKFSWWLYKRARKYGRERIYIATINMIDGINLKPDLAALKAGDAKQRSRLMIGYEIESNGWFHGMRLHAVTNPGAASCDFAYGPNFRTSDWLDVTDWFWKEYISRGRCIIHGDATHEWIQINANARKCAYCGKHERRTVKTVRTIERQEIWSAD